MNCALPPGLAPARSVRLNLYRNGTSRQAAAARLTVVSSTKAKTADRTPGASRHPSAHTAKTAIDALSAIGRGYRL